MDIQIQGLADLQRRLKRLPEKIQRVTLIKATQAGALPILAAATAKVPRLTGNLASKIRVKFTRRGINSAEASIGVFGLSGAARKRAVAKHVKKTGSLPTWRELGDVFYALFVEKGHDILVGRRRKADSELSAGRLTRRRRMGVTAGTVVGHVAAQPFLRPAIDETKDQVVRIVAQVLREELDRAEQL